MKEKDIQLQKVQRIPNKMNPKRSTPRLIIIKIKAPKEEQLVTYRGAHMRLSTDLSTETLQTRRDWQKIIKVKKSQDLQPRLLYSAKLSFRINKQIKSSPDKKKLK